MPLLVPRCRERFLVKALRARTRLCIHTLQATFTLIKYGQRSIGGVKATTRLLKHH